MRYASARPSPRPRGFVVTKGSKTRSSRPAGMPSPSSRDLDLDQRPGPGADVDPAPEHGVEGQPCGEREPPAAGHGLDPVLNEVLEHLDEAIRVGPEGRQARIVAPHELDLVGAGRRLREEASRGRGAREGSRTGR